MNLKNHEDRDTKHRVTSLRPEVPVSRQPLERDLNQSWRVAANTMQNYESKRNKDDQGAQHQVVPLTPGSPGPRRKAPGIEGLDTPCASMHLQHQEDWSLASYDKNTCPYVCPFHFKRLFLSNCLPHLNQT